MSWRPDDWINPYGVEAPVFEAGADAMLGAVVHELNHAQDTKELQAKMDVLAKSVLASITLKAIMEVNHGIRKETSTEV